MPVAMRQRVLTEAGHRCTIPACRTVPYADVQKHTSENLIALCLTCHTRHDRGDIDRLPLHGVKANLAMVTRSQPLPAPHACTHEDPVPGKALMAGSLGTSCKVPPAGFEPAHTAPEGMP
ncbi:HNH endonuclease [Streptomyces luteogriseus]|uniref:HNH endonuclease n=1 Tax=Streptomyces luteogriseus TaxID=68233 RepID=UPI0037B98482